MALDMFRELYAWFNQSVAMPTPWLNNLKMTYEYICSHLSLQTQKYISKPEARWHGSILPTVYFQTCCFCKMLGNDDESPFRIITVQSFGSQPLRNLTVTSLVPLKWTSFATVKKALLQTLLCVLIMRIWMMKYRSVSSPGSSVLIIDCCNLYSILPGLFFHQLFSP